MITIKTPDEIKTLREGGRILVRILDMVSKKTIPGVSTDELNDYVNELCNKEDVIPVFLNYTPYGAKRAYPASICISINDEVVHGIPNEQPRILREGDIVSLDMGISYKKLIVDSAITVGVGEIDEKAKRLLDITKKALEVGVNAVHEGVKTGDIGEAIESFVKKYKFAIAEDLGGHGVGYHVHEDPFIPNIGMKGQGPALKEGMVIAIEPMLNEGTAKVYIDKDGYTIKTADGKRSAHFEHTVAITKDGCEILTSL